jgi:predicted nucleotide-binding protein
VARSSELCNLVEAALANAVSHLLTSRDRQGHWRDVRSTAAASWALSQVVKGRNAPADYSPFLHGIISDAATWLAAQSKVEEGGLSWESEGWDTSVAILALVEAQAYEDRIDRAVSWLESIRCSRSGVWYDEVWETTLATVALLRREATRTGPKRNMDSLVIGVMRWLVGIPSKSSGEFVSPHYSGFLLWIDAEIHNGSLRASTLTSLAYIEFRAKVDACASWLHRAAVQEPEELWCPYTFGNAYIAYSIARHPTHRRSEDEFLAPVVQWLCRKQGTSGAFEDIEDTALAIAALSTIQDLLEVRGTPLLRALATMEAASRSSTERCFIGYAGSSRGVALDVKDILRNNVPGLQLVDWVWDFRVGATIIGELEYQAKECQMALFLVTKDDALVADNAVLYTPRDNIVFEIGFFSGKLGREKTILLVEEGTELPSDWGGVIYLTLRDRLNLASIHGPLLRAVNAILESNRPTKKNIRYD